MGSTKDQPHDVLHNADGPGRPGPYLNTHQSPRPREHLDGDMELRRALRAAQTGIWHWDLRADRQILDESLIALIGLPVESWSGTFDDFLQLIHADDRSSVAEAFSRCATKGVGLDTQFRIVRPDGEVRWLQDKGDVFADAEGQPLF